MDTARGVLIPTVGKQLQSDPEAFLKSHELHSRIGLFFSIGGQLGCPTTWALMCINGFLQRTIKLGRTGKVTQIDESLFRHKHKVHTTFYICISTFMTLHTFQYTVVSQRQSNIPREVSFWNGRYFYYSFTWIYGGGTGQKSNYTSAYHSAACPPWH